ncbi:MAG: DNA polymerase III subunit delta' [Aquabacterium sp.]|uniref:DNA polymerase III subunit delta' n=1 Tax=Aquabacterium sp. TaxID=1872578 RepID=UPI00272645A6|nr:DNA polymerase III subunit delta' [Aquabacterium sp.]MDO9003417.1 DNA polymerase III subunit delta' [Aquabacterium sp.]
MSDLLPWLQQPLAQALAQAHGHATLVHGPQGVGQFEFSMALAQSWLCEAQAPGSLFKPACGVCGSCHLISARSHPDLVVVVPEALQAALGWTSSGDDEEGASEKSGKTKKLSQDIKVESIRAVVQFSQQTPSRGRAKVVVVHPAERMNMVSSNTLLKTLEEPPGMLRFVVSAGSLDELLPTVRSRCQAWRLPLPDKVAAIAWLREQINGLSEADASVLLQAAGGQPLTARDRHAMGLDAVRWPQIPRDVAQGQSGAMAGWPLPLVVETLQKLCHDLACMATGASPRYFPESSLHRDGDLTRLTAWSGELRKASRTAEHPWNLNLRVESLLQQARLALRFNK